MTDKELMQMAREACGEPAWDGGVEWTWEEVERFANIVAAAEREACAQICDEQMEWGEINKSMAVAAGNCADLIRERGQG